MVVYGDVLWFDGGLMVRNMNEVVVWCAIDSGLVWLFFKLHLLGICVKLSKLVFIAFVQMYFVVLFVVC
jgi:hypothetical protein